MPRADELPLTGHLEELRSGLLLSIAPFLIVSVAGVAFSERILLWIFSPLRPLDLAPYLFRLGDAVVLRIRAGTLAGAAATAPWTAYQLYRFARPGLRDTEARALRRLSLLAGLGFTAGATGLFLAVAPGLVRLWAVGLTGDTMLSAEAYFTMWETACLWAGLVAAAAAAAPYGIHIYRNRRTNQ